MEFPWLPAPSRFLASFPLIGSVPTVATAGIGPERPSDYSFHVPQPEQQMATSGKKAKPLKGDKLASLAPVHTAPCTRGREGLLYPTPPQGSASPPAPSEGTGKGERTAELARRTARHRHLQQSAGREKPSPAGRNHYRHELCDPGQKNKASLRAAGTETGSRYLRVEVRHTHPSTSKDRAEMAAVGAIFRSGLRGAMALPQQQRAWSSGSDQLGDLGRGAGKGGGGGGSIREAGGAFGKREAAEEERYFREKEREQLANLRKHHEEEISHHKKEIDRLQKEIERHKYKIKNLQDDD
ncbi:hypothetical protein Chor_005459 [Crotalus horridus]